MPLLAPSLHTGKAKGALAKIPYDYPQGGRCYSPTLSYLTLFLYI